MKLKFFQLALLSFFCLILALVMMITEVAADDFLAIHADNIEDLRPFIAIPAASPIQFSADGSLLAAGLINRCCQYSSVLWNMQNFSHQSFGDANLLGISPDGRFAISAGFEKTQLHHLETGEATLLLAVESDKIVFSPDSRYFITRSRSNRLFTVWETATGEELTVLPIVGSYTGEKMPVFSPDSEEFIFFDRDVRVWQTDDLSERLHFDIEIYALHYIEDGAKWLMLDSNGLLIVDTETGELLHEFPLDGSSSRMLLSPNEDRLLLASNEYWQDAQLWDISDSAAIHKLADISSDETFFRNMNFSRDSQWVLLYGGYGNRDFLIYDGTSGDLITTVTGHEAEITQIQFNPDSSLIFSSDLEGSLRIWRWDGAQAEEIRQIAGNSFLLSPDASLLAVHLQNVLMLYTLPHPERPAQNLIVPARILPSSINLRAEPNQDSEVIGYASGESVIVSGRNGDFFYLPQFGGWVRNDPSFIQLAGDFPVDYLAELSPETANQSFATATPTSAVPTPMPQPSPTATFTPGPPPEFTLEPATPIVLPESPEGLSRINADNLEELALLDVLPGREIQNSFYPNSSGAIAPDGSFIITNERDNPFQFWNLLDFSQISSPANPSQRSISAFSPNGEWMAYTFDYSGNVYLRNLLDGREEAIFTLSNYQSANYIVFSPDNRTLVFGVSYTSYVYDIESRSLRFEIPSVEGVYITEDSQTIVILPANSNGLLRAYEIETGQLAYQFATPAYRYGRNAISINDEKIAVGTSEGISIFSLVAENRGEEIFTFAGRYQEFVFSPDGEILAGLSDTGLLQLWNLRTGENFYSLETPLVEVNRYITHRSIGFSPDASMLLLGNPLQILRLDSSEIVTIAGDFAVMNPRFSPEMSSLLVDTMTSTMVFGIPNEMRPVWEPISGQVNSSGINLRRFPDAEAEVIGYASGEVLISGIAYNGTAVYLSELGGWIWSGESYLDLGEHSLSELPALYVPETGD